MSVYSVLKLRNDYTVFEELPASIGDLTVVNAVLRGGKRIFAIVKF